jgi:SAM-dependent methyltransferase
MKTLGWQVEGIEPDHLAAESAASVGIKVLSCTLEEAVLESNTYDAIVMHHVLEHLPDPRTALLQLITCLKPGGVLISISPNPNGIIAKQFGRNWYALDAPRHLVLPSSQGYRRMLEGTEVNVAVSSTMQIGFWMFRESFSLKLTGSVGNLTYSLIPKIATTLSSLLLLFFPEIGEELICYATKP